MKNFMKKIIVGILSLGFLLSGVNSANASGWNQYPGDCPAINIGNYTTGAGINPGSCWNLTNVSATSGQIINVKVFYDNTNGVDANNTNISLTKSPSTGSSTNFSFSGNLNSSAGSLPLSQVTANISTNETLTFSQARWYQNGSYNPTSFPSGQTGAEAFNGSLSLGTIPNNDWGAIVFSFNISNNGGGSNCTITSSLSANPTYINQGSSSTLNWNTSGCASAVITGPNGTVSNNLNGPATVYPTNIGSNNYTLTATSSTGQQITQNTSVYVNNYQYNNCYINYFTVNGQNTVTIQAGNSVNLAWSTTGCTSVTVSGPSINSNSYSGNQTLYPQYSGTYTINAYGNGGGNQTQSVYVNVNNNQYNNCVINSFYASQNNITSGQPVTLTWNTTGCTSVSISNVGYNLSASYNQIVYPTTTTVYTLNAYSSYGGSPSQSLTINVNGGPIYNACAVTSVATSVTRTSAQLNGIISSGTSNNAYFEYGQSADNLNLRTPSQTTSGSYYATITGLIPDTIYYFRAVADCNGSTNRGTVEFLDTLANQVIHPIIIQGTTVIGTSSPIMLRIEDRYQSIGIGDTVDYTVTYKNIGKSLLTNPVVQVIVPRGINITNSSAGTYSTDTNTLTVPIEDLRPGDEGVIYLEGQAVSITSNTAQIVTTAILVYTNPNNAQENAIAYVLNTPRFTAPATTDNNLGAAAFFLGFFPSTLLGWLLLVTLILLIILLARRYNKKSTVHVTTPTGTTTTTHY